MSKVIINNHHNKCH